ncbi:Ferripyoverdine receptor precursor [Achromobacter denitrificans]|uniref:TonB-dependent siderophore receptor n=1 Tax=Achromobacter denitrificans TaxID=32002 RepID=UPI000786E7F3|nr:TonB-dependent receptor [Achromobacter denitrificans]ASC67433.1 TonB-dependent siderophore receptor [Achromobacter denitrificans]QKH41502.1 TonB-dependent siderophore receptor [Achromobacter denitrificans]QKH51355.1 TonB-dependent siderophore receptor [Achromobacter denitrificans]CAB3725830.1 Ferric-pseudobactin BN7/BN8 receptor [Achromobacter denitrificans]SUU26262.1 Ferripyoverdine receptor precursor [Achromobacter denitrificans]
MRHPHTAPRLRATPNPLRGSRLTPVRHAASVTALAAALAATIAPPAFAQSAVAPAAAPSASGATRQYDIPAGPLSEALTHFSNQSGIYVAGASALADGRQSAGLQGAYAPQAALDALLAGTQLQAVRREDGGYVLRRAPAGPQAAVLPAVTVSATALTGLTEGTGSYTTRAMGSATKLELSPRETPQTVSVITRQRIEDQDIATLGDAVKATPGLTVTKWGGERERYTSRGFQINNLMVDGLPIEYEEAALSTGPMSMYDRVEIVRGVSGLMEGAGTPGGSINLIRKRPTRDFQGSFTAAAGSWDNYLADLDAGGPLNEAGTLRARGVMSYQDKHSYIDSYRNKRTLLYGILEADVTERTTVSLGASYSKEDNPGVDWNGMGTYPDGRFLPISRSTRMSPDWSYWNKRSVTIFGGIDHEFANGWRGKLAAAAIRSKMDMLGTYIGQSTWDENGDPSMTLRGGGYNYDRDQETFDASLSGPYSLFGRQHDLVVGASHRRSSWHDVGGGATQDGDFTLATFNPLNWNPGAIPLPTIGEYGEWRKEQEVRQSGLYAMTRMRPTDRLSVILGSRVDWYSMDTVQYDGDYPYGEGKYDVVRKFTPYAGVVYDLDAAHSVYASWTRIFNPQNYATASGGLLAPQEGTNYELGIKGEYLEGRLNTSLAVFRIDLDNLPDQLPNAQCQGGLTSCYAPAGQVRSQGFEAEISGEILPGWQLAAGYTYASAKRRGESSSYDPTGTFSVGDRYGTNIPRHLFKLFTTYRLPGEWNRWRVGGSLHVQNRIYTPWGVSQGGYAVVGLNAGLDVNKQLNFALNVNNVFDRRYYASVGSMTDANFFGEPRSVTLTARYSF